MYGNAQNYNTDFFSLHPQGDAGLPGQPGAPGMEGKRVSEREQAAACVGQTRRVCVTDVTAKIWQQILKNDTPTAGKIGEVCVAWP